MAICEIRESHINGCEEREKSPKFSQLLLFSFVKQHDSLLIEGSKNCSLE